MSASDDYAAGGEAGYTGSYVDTGTAFGLPEGDVRDYPKMSQFQSAPASNQASAPWWQNVVAFGLTRAIDNTFPGQAGGVQGNTNPGSFAGQNGRSYNQVGGLNAAPVRAGGSLSRQVAGMSPLMLLGIAALAYFALKK